jgi:hypothetical protein
MPPRPRCQRTPSAVECEGLTVSQKTAVDAYAAWQNGDIVAGNGGDRFQKRFAVFGTYST